MDDDAAALAIPLRLIAGVVQVLSVFPFAEQADYFRPQLADAEARGLDVPAILRRLRLFDAAAEFVSVVEQVYSEEEAASFLPGVNDN